MHLLLAKQLAELRRSSPDGRVDLDAFIDIVNRSYQQYDAELHAKEQSRAFTGAELIELNLQIQEENRLRVQAIMDNMIDGVITFNKDRIIESVNPAIEKTFGYPAKELVGKPLDCIIPGDYITTTLQQLESTENEFTPRIRVREATGLREDGSTFPIEWSISKMQFRNERLFIAVLRDLTQMRRIITELCQYRERFESLTNNITGAIYRRSNDPELNFSYLSKPFEQMTGYSPEELIERRTYSYVSLIYPEDLTIFRETMRNAIKTQKPYTMEYRLIRKDGNIVWVYESGQGKFDALGNLEWLDGTLFNITDRKAAEIALRESEERFRTIVETSPIPVFITSLTDGKILFANAPVNTVFGLHPDEHPTLQSPDLFARREDLDRLMAQFNAYRQLRNHEVEMKRADGSTFWAAVSMNYITFKGRQALFTALFDITQHKQVEVTLQKAKDAAETANRAKSEFLANMSHELRTPLNAVLGFTELMKNQVSNPAHREYLATITGSGRSLLTLIDDILDLSKIEAGKMEIQPHPLHLTTLMQEIRDIFSYKLHEKDLNFHLEIREDVPEWVMLDEIRLRQVLVNLVGNAIKFTTRGYVKISVHSHNSQTDKDCIDLEIDVEDTGIGIPAGQIKRIFEAFVQKDGQNTQKYGGTGLGLAITRRLVEMMGGHITVKSVPDNGSTFRIHLKSVMIADKAGRPAPDTDTSNTAVVFKPAGVLVIDDIPANRELIKSYLEHTALQIVDAADGETGIELAKSASPDIVLMDIRLPCIDGYRATEILKKDPRTCRIPIIALTAYAMPEDRERALAAGCDMYLSKPISQADLVRALKHFLPHKETVVEPADTEPDTPPSAGAITITDSGKYDHLVALLKELEEEHLKHWESVSEMIIVDDVIKFSNRILQIGEDNKLPMLSQWGQQAREQAEMFEIEKLTRTLAHFPDQLKGLRKSLENWKKSR